MEPAGWLQSAGQGRICVIAADIFGAYWDHPSRELLEIWRSTLKILEFEPLVEVQTPYPVEVVTAHDGDNLLIHLVNQLEGQDRLFYPLQVPPIGPLRVKVRTASPHGTVIRWPEGIELNSTMEQGQLCIELEGLHIHTCVEVRGVRLPEKLH